MYVIVIYPAANTVLVCITIHTGQVMSTKKEDLIRILDRFNIQVDNPVSLLNQETSRNFLHSTNPATLYQVNALHCIVIIGTVC